MKLTTARRVVTVVAVLAALVAVVAASPPARAAAPAGRGLDPLATSYAAVDWEGLWMAEIEAARGLDPALLEMRAASADDESANWARSRLRRLANEAATRETMRDREDGDTVGRWRLLVAQYFAPEDVDWAMGRIACESTGDPYAENPRSSAAGLFQHLHRYWPERAEAAGWAGAPVWDPEANIAVAAWLFYEGGGPGHWTC